MQKTFKGATIGVALFLTAFVLLAANTVVEQATDILIRNTANVPGLEIVKGTNQTNPYIVAGTQSSQIFSVGSTGLVTAVSFSGDGSQLTGISGAQTPVESDIDYADYSGTNATAFGADAFYDNNNNPFIVISGSGPGVDRTVTIKDKSNYDRMYFADAPGSEGTGEAVIISDGLSGVHRFHADTNYTAIGAPDGGLLISHTLNDTTLTVGGTANSITLFKVSGGATPLTVAPDSVAVYGELGVTEGISVNSLSGINVTNVFVDADGNTNSIVVTGGIITDWTITPP